MKKLLIRLIAVLVVLAIIGVVVTGLFVGNIIKAGVEKVGPAITKTSMKVDSVSLSMAGLASLNGFVLGDPEGYKGDHSISVGKAIVNVSVPSLLSDKIVVHSIEVHNADINFEGNPLGANNLQKILDNVNAAAASLKSSGKNSTGSTGAAKKLEVDDFLISGATVQFNGIPLPLPDIHLQNLGKGPDGITPAELVQDVLTQVTTESLAAIANSAAGAVKGAAKTLTDGVGKIGTGLGGLFNKN